MDQAELRDTPAPTPVPETDAAPTASAVEQPEKTTGSRHHAVWAMLAAFAAPRAEGAAG